MMMMVVVVAAAAAAAAVVVIALSPPSFYNAYLNAETILVVTMIFWHRFPAHLLGFDSLPSSPSAAVVGAPQMTSRPVSSISPLFSTALWHLANSRPVHSLTLSFHLFLCLRRLLSPFIVPCKMILARPDKRETCPYHFSLRLFTMVRSPCGPIASRILAQTFPVGNMVFV